MKAEEIMSTESNKETEPNTESSSTTSSLLPRILSGSIGSIVTALAVTPLEVVKIRQQLSGAESTTAHPHNHTNKTTAIHPCPRGCTVILNNGLMECNIKSSLFEVSLPYTRSFNSTHQTFVPRYNGGMMHTLLSIVHYEGLGGLYAGLKPTLLMSVPNTVLYFTVYDEISWLLRRKLSTTQNDDKQCRRRDEDSKSQVYIPLVAGSTARLLASLTTAPLELIRTRQASVVLPEKNASAMQEVRYLLRTNGLSSLYVGLIPTLWRDVPFSAIYWMCLERMKWELSKSEGLGVWGGKYYREECGTKMPPSVEAMHAFVSGAVAGSIAAAVTTPFDVVKTRRQMVMQGLNDGKSSSAVGYGRVHPLGILGHMRQIVRREGVSGLWKGNTTRMVKVAPACAIMISVYEFGKRAFGEVM
jgi:solute carrier family 25 protein 39/40